MNMYILYVCVYIYIYIYTEREREREIERETQAAGADALGPGVSRVPNAWRRPEVVDIEADTNTIV